MHRIYTILIFFLCINQIYGQAGMWTWVHGDTTAAYSIIYGTQGVPSPANSPSGGYEGCEWTDKQGKFWFFGSSTYAFDNNLWKYDPSTNMWTWMKGPGVGSDSGFYGIQGVPAISNNPPCRGFGPASWVDTTGNLWLYGGFNYLGQNNNLNDLWKYDISTNMWTWVSGSNIPNQSSVHGTQGIPSILNTPGARTEAGCTWTDNFNNLWMFGGMDASGVYNYYNDLWRYNIATNEWTWMKGADTAFAPGIYGTLGQSNPLNTPSARWCYSNWKDVNGNLWLFGGRQASTCVVGGVLNDLWRYNIATDEWTWINGANYPCNPGSAGTQCISDSSNCPKGRFENRSNWVDNNGNFWMFGGGTSDSIVMPGLSNELWMYDVADNKWTWVSGDTINNQIGNFGIKGVASPCNAPRGTMGSVSWFDASTNSAYVFGGYQYNTAGGGSIRNVLWKYTIDTTCIVYSCPTGIIENTSSNPLHIFPNPTNSLLLISFQSYSNENIEIRLFNLIGEEIYLLKEKSSSVKFFKEINLQTLSSGVYLLQLMTKDRILNAKIIKQ